MNYGVWRGEPATRTGASPADRVVWVVPGEHRHRCTLRGEDLPGERELEDHAAPVGAAAGGRRTGWFDGG